MRPLVPRLIATRVRSQSARSAWQRGRRGPFAGGGAWTGVAADRSRLHVSRRMQLGLAARACWASRLLSTAVVEEAKPAKHVGFRPTFNYVSKAGKPTAAEPEAAARLPPMSADGGTQAEFEVYWSANERPRKLSGRWLARRAHPQVNSEAYWYDDRTGRVVWRRPAGGAEGALDAAAEDENYSEELAGVGPVWEMSIPELKEALADGREEQLGLSYALLARRAVAEYEGFRPRVLSWHDYQHITFWFFGGLRLQRGEAGGKRAFFEAGKVEATDMFAPRPFFEESAALMRQRLRFMHPINLTYFVWTFVRAGIVLPEFMDVVGDHLSKGRMPMCDRCALGTMVWNYGKMSIRHDRLFEAAAEELARPNRVRSLAPRNYQNAVLAYSWRLHQHSLMLDSLAQGMRRLLDGHRPPRSKLSVDVLFSYTCKDGFEVKADAFRITSLSVTLRAMHKMSVETSTMACLLSSMVDYTCRSVAESPRMMREDGDACNFLINLAHYLEHHPGVPVRHLLDPERLQYAQLCESAPASSKSRLMRIVGRMGFTIRV